METFFTPLTFPPYIEPGGLIEGIGLVLMGLLVVWGLIRSREKSIQWGRMEWTIFIFLVVRTIFSSLYIGVRFPATGVLPRPLLPEEPRGPTVLFLSTLPWILAGGILGPLPAAILGFLSGLLRGLFDSHSLFTILQTTGLALVYSLAVRQRYRTPVYRLLRHPLPAAVAVGVLFIPVYGFIGIFESSGPLVSRVDYSLTRLGVGAAAMWIELVVAGLIAEGVSRAAPDIWGQKGQTQPSPVETSLQLRFFYGTGPLVLLLLSTLMVGDWFVAGSAARRMLEDQLANTARIAAESIPFYLEAGQNLVLQMAGDPRLLSSPREDLPGILAQDMRSVPYFRQLYVLDETGAPVAGYPEAMLERIGPTLEEQTGIQLALRGVSIQTYTVPPIKNETTAQVSFLASIRDSSGAVKGVLLGRSDLATNPFTKPIIQAFQEMQEPGPEAAGGVDGMILDENQIILYHPNATRVMTTYLGKTSSVPGFYDETSSEGTRSLVYFQPTMGRSWAVALVVPAQRAQQLALTIAVPMLIMILFMAIVAIISLRLGLRVVTASLETLAFEAGRISRGQLDHTLPVKGVDEVGRLSRAFEQMRVSLKARLEELNRLLSVSQGVASSLEMKDTVRPILEAALSGSAWSARVVLTPDTSLDSQSGQVTRFGLGLAAEDYAYLDDQLLALSKTHDRLVLPNLTRGKGLNFSPGKPRPGAILAVALRRENQYYGSLWIAYDRPRVFSEEEVRFLITLAGEAALAAANARLYSTAEIGRQRLGAVLASTPDPVFVTDHQNRLLLHNPAAQQLPGFSGSAENGESIEKLIDNPDLLGMLAGDTESTPTRELSLGNGKVYYTTVSSVVVEGQAVGKICILRDITHFKQLDSLKSDFVATVSHDLRSPLTLMRGYATMLQMVGDLNDQQKSYVRKIISGVESMSRLVNNLLDLGRIEAGVGLQVEPVGLVEVVDRVVNSLQLQAAQKNIQISRALPEEGDPSLEADPALLQQALYNLVENAIKYTPVGGGVEVHGKIVDGKALFEVRDNGIGIAPLDQPRLFEKFYRGGQREAYLQRGSGLGLAIVKSIIERHGGQIWVESTLGKGSVFYVEIPVRQGMGEPVGPTTFSAS